MTFDWSYFTDFDDATIILKELTKRDLALLSSAMSFLESEGDWENGTWDTIAEKLSEIQHRISHDTYVCPEGGAADYTLHEVITLLSDATSYTITDLDLLTGRDLRIEFLVATTSGSVRDLRLQINELTSSIYYYTESRFATTTGLSNGTLTYYPMRYIAAASDTPQLNYGYVSLDIPNWKEDSTYPIVRMSGVNASRHTFGKCILQSAVAVDSLTIFMSSGDVKAGSEIMIYSRG